MNSYTLLLAMHGVLRNKVLTLLICAAVAIGVGGAISAFTLYHAVSADPIPWKSSQLFAVQIDNWGPAERKNG
jgi:putative ABC transport system permease protein